RGRPAGGQPAEKRTQTPCRGRRPAVVPEGSYWIGIGLVSGPDHFTRCAYMLTSGPLVPAARCIVEFLGEPSRVSRRVNTRHPLGPPPLGKRSARVRPAPGG